jgi:PmbA protein
MLDKIVAALKSRSDLAGWTVRHITSQGAQVYAVPTEIEARRSVSDEKYKIDVLRNTKAVDGSAAMGAGDATLLPGGDIDKAIETAAAVAGLVANPPYSLPAAAEIPDVPLVDAALKKDSAASLDEMMETLRNAAAKHKGIRLTSGEAFGDIINTHLVNSRGIDAKQEETRVHMEFILQSKKGERNSETYKEITRRRVVDMDIAAAVDERARFTADLLDGAAPPSFEGPVLIRGEALATLMNGDALNPSVIRSLSSAESKYAKISSWEIGQSILRGEVKGDALNVWANRTVPYGLSSNRFDAEGIPAQRIELVRDGKLSTFYASQKYADYLKIPATGDFGVTEVPAGKTPLAGLLEEPYVEVSMFSWFNPDSISGDFATEIRLGHLVKDGKSTPFKGGQLIGNVLDALADCRWSAETGFFGVYQGPIAARFSNLKVANAAG